MDETADSVRVFIYGDEYSIKGDVDADTTRKVADYVDRKTMEFQKNTATRDKFKVAVLSALNIAGELFEYKRKCENLTKQLEELRNKTEHLGKTIDACL